MGNTLLGNRGTKCRTPPRHITRPDNGYAGYERVENARGDQLALGDRVVWVYEDPGEGVVSSLEIGTIRWLGHITGDARVFAGVEFDRALGQGSGWYENVQIFTCERDHGAFVIVDALLRLDNLKQPPKMPDKPFSVPPANSTDEEPKPAPPDGMDETQKTPTTPPLRPLLASMMTKLSNAASTLESVKTYLGLPGDPEPVEDNSNNVELNEDAPSPPTAAATSKPSPPQGLDGHGQHLATAAGDDHSHNEKKKDKVHIHRDSNDNLELDSPPLKTKCMGFGDTGEKYRPRQFQGSGWKPPANPPTHPRLFSPEPIITSHACPRSKKIEDILRMMDERKESQTPSQLYSCPWLPQMPQENEDYNEQIVEAVKPKFPIPFMNNNEDEGPKVVTPPWTRLTYDEMNTNQPKGIQGRQNSCYLDSSLFSLFAFYDGFDHLLTMDVPSPTIGNSLNVPLIQSRLRAIVNQLRGRKYVSAHEVMRLRESMSSLSSTITSEEMDAQEFLQLLFQSVFHLPEFLRMDGQPIQNEYFHQLLVPESHSLPAIPTVQQLLDTSFQFQRVRLRGRPAPCLILQMPRSGNDFQKFTGIVPNLTIDISSILEPEESGQQQAQPCQFNLFAVICIKSNHFLSFVRVTSSTFAAADPWIFFDSMAIKNGHSGMTPEVHKLAPLGSWIEEVLHQESSRVNLMNMKSFDEPPKDLEYLQQLLRDVYMCFYMPSS